MCVGPNCVRRAAIEQSLGRELEIVCVADVGAALAVLATREVAVLVTSLRVVDAEALLREVHTRSPRTFRIATSVQADIDQMLNLRDDGIVASYLVTPWRDDELHQLLRWACDTWALAGDVVALSRAPSRAEPTDLLHDLKSPLMTILANAEHLESLSAGAPALAEALERVPLAPEHRRLLAAILADLHPISEELTTATRRLAQIAEQLDEDTGAQWSHRRTGSQ